MNAGYVASCAAIMGVVANVFSSVSSGIENSRELLVTKVARVGKKRQRRKQDDATTKNDDDSDKDVDEDGTMM